MVGARDLIPGMRQWGGNAGKESMHLESLGSAGGMKWNAGKIPGAGLVEFAKIRRALVID